MKASCVIVVCLLGVVQYCAFAADLERIPYNNPGLTVDLGVGLWAWPMPMDVDGDGQMELVVACPDKPYNGVYVFKQAAGRGGAVVFKPGERLSSAGANVQVSYVNGKPQVLTPGFTHPDFLRLGLAQPVKIEGVKPNPHSNSVRANMWRWVDYDGDGLLDLIAGVGDWKEYGWDNAYDANGIWKNGPLHGYLYVMRNHGTADVPRYADPFLVQAGGKVLDVFGWPSPNFADWDDDGDLDILCGEFLDSFTYFENTGTRTAPTYAVGRRVRTPEGTYLSMHVQMITPTACDWDGDALRDLICGDEDGRVAFLRNTGRQDKSKTPVFEAPVYFQQQAQDLKFGVLVTPFGVDFDGDGDWDFICGNSAGNITYFENLSGKGVEQPKWAAPRFVRVQGRPLRIIAGANGSIQGPCEAKWGYTTQTVCDWDGDGQLDLVVNSILGYVVWYRGQGTLDFEAAQPITVEWEGEQPELAYGWLKPNGKGLLTQWRTTPFTLDWNKDGLCDLIMLDQEGYLAYFERFKKEGKLFLKQPRRIFCDDQGKALQLNANSAGRSGRRKLCLVDWDGDGNIDILANSQNATLYRQVKQEKGKVYFHNSGNLHAKNIEGHDVSPTVVDFDNNGIPDFVGGAEDGYLYYLRNPALQEARDAKADRERGRKPVLECFMEAPHCFDGREGLLLPDSLKLLPVWRDCAITLRVKASQDVAHQQYLFAQNAGQPDRCEIGISYSAKSVGQVFWWQANALTLISKTTIFDDAWHEVTVIRRNGVVALYIDGQLEGEGASALGFDPTVPWTVGMSAKKEFLFKGQIEKLRVYRYTVNTPAEIR